MPNIKSAKKRCRTSLESQQRNRAVKSLVRSARRKLLESIESNEKDQSQSLYREYCSTLDKAVKKGVLKANVSSRGKSRLTARLNAMA